MIPKSSARESLCNKGRDERAHGFDDPLSVWDIFAYAHPLSRPLLAIPQNIRPAFHRFLYAQRIALHPVCREYITVTEEG